MAVERRRAKCYTCAVSGNWEMKIGSVYILSRRSIARMLATITAALMTLFAATTAQAATTVHRIHDATVALVSLDRQMVGRLARTVVPDFMYLEYKSLYLELKTFAACHDPPCSTGRARCPERAERRLKDKPPYQRAATKADLRTAIHAAVKTILRGEDANAAKPGPRLTAAKRRQIEAAEAYRQSHAGCSLHNACIRSFVAAKGGYGSAKNLYRVMSRKGDN